MLQHLETCISTNTPVEAHLIDTSPLPADLLPLIGPANHIIFNAPELDPTGAVSNLLDKVLAQISFAQLLTLFPPDFVNERIDDLCKDPGVSVAILRLISGKIDDSACRSFLAENDIATKVVSQYLNRDDIPIAVVSQTESFLRYYLTVEEAPPQVPRGSEKSRYVEYLLILADFGHFVDPNDYYFTEKELADMSEENPLLAILIIQFCADLFSKHPSVPQQHISMLNAIYACRSHPFVDAELANLVVKLSGDQKYLEWCAQTIVKLDIDRDLMVRIYSNANPITLRNVEFDFPLLSARYFGVLLNLVADTELMAREIDYFTSPRLLKLSADLLFRLILEMSRHPHAQRVLFGLPQVLSTFIENNNIRDTALFAMKRSALDNLVASEYGLAWRDIINEEIDRMTNGERSVGVDVMSSTR